MLFGGFFLSVISRTSKSVSKRQARNERGVVLVVITLMLTIIMGCAGMAVDLGNWYYVHSKQQKAADAAALAAAPFLPTNFAKAKEVAEDVLQQNGVSLSHVVSNPVEQSLTGDDRFEDHVYMSQDASDPRVMKVQVGKVVHNNFIALLGLNEQRLTRTGSATYQAEIPMGSPAQVLGTEPANDKQGNLSPASDAGYNGKYWLNLSGPMTLKGNGDQFAAGRCQFGASTGCASSGLNTDFAYDSETRSHRYTIHIPKGNTSPVTVQVFDGAYVEVGDKCDLNNGNLEAAAAATGDNVRFAKGPGSGYCTADFKQGTQGVVSTLTASTYKSGPLNSLGAKINAVTFPSATTPGAVASQMAAGTSGNPNNPSLSDSFRAWSTIATITAPGDYTVEVKTPAGAGGTNRFSLRAGILGAGDKFNTTASSKITVAAQGHLAVFTNASAADTSFYFAKLTSSAAGRTIKVDLFDIGDATGGDGVDLQLIAPQGASGLPNGFSSLCTQIGPWDGYSQPTGSTCGIKNAVASNGYNSHSAVLSVTIPDTYKCESDSGPNCWMALRFVVKNPSGITSSNPSVDTTTWSVQACGRPLALVDNDPAKRSTSCDK